MFTRSVYVGLQSESAGTLRVGRNTTPYFLSAILFNPLVDSYHFSPTIFHTYVSSVVARRCCGDAVVVTAWRWPASPTSNPSAPIGWLGRRWGVRSSVRKSGGTDHHHFSRDASTKCVRSRCG